MTTPKHQKGIRIFLGILTTGFLLFIMALSFYIGKIYANRSNKALVTGIQDILLLSPILKNANVPGQDILNVYEGKVEVADLDTFCYDIPKVPTPFVVSAPRPGWFGNAFINSQQFRYDRDIALPKPGDVYRIFFTGGSVAFGGGAPNNATTISGFLEKKLNDSLGSIIGKKIEVINAACPAWCSTQERIWIENRLSEMQPDMVISFSGNNDVHWSSSGHNTLFFRSYWDHFLNKVNQNVYSSIGMGNYPEILPDPVEKVSPEVMAGRVAKNVFLVNALAQEQGFIYVYALQPNLFSINKGLSPHEKKWRDRTEGDKVTYFKDGYGAIHKVLSNTIAPGFYYIDQRAVFDLLPPGTPVFYDSYHFGDRGNRLVADDLAKNIAPLIVGKK